MIKKILDVNKKKIGTSMYPAFEGFKILCLDHKVNYKSAKLVFYSWAKKVGLLVNMNNF